MNTTETQSAGSLQPLVVPLGESYAVIPLGISRDDYEMLKDTLRLWENRIVRREEARLSVSEARRRKVCRICKGPDTAPLVLNYGKEYAHEECLKRHNELS